MHVLLLPWICVLLKKKLLRLCTVHFYVKCGLFYCLSVSIIIQGPILQSTQTHLHRSLGDDNVLLVKFAEGGSTNNSRTSAQRANDLYGQFGKEGIRVGPHLYRFFGNPTSC